MRGDRLDTVKRAYAAYAAPDLDRFLTFVDEAVEWHTLPDEPEGGVFHSRARVRNYFMRYMDLLHSWRMEIQEPNEVGQWVLVPMRLWAVGKASGVETEIRVVHIVRIRDSQIVELRATADLESAIALAESMEDSLRGESLPPEPGLTPQ